MLDLTTATCEQFDRLSNRQFTIRFEAAAPVELALVQVDQRGAYDPAVHKRQSFSLLFHGPLEPLLPQRIYRLENHELGAFDVFLVPVGGEADGMRYEAIFT